MKILIINGPNINMIGKREPEIYGKRNYRELVKFCRSCASKNNVKIKIYQTNSEGKIITAIQKAINRFDAIIINPAGYTHTSIAIPDALKAADLPVVEVHLSDIFSREEYRRRSYVSEYAEKTICGKGFEGYKEAIEYLCK